MLKLQAAIYILSLGLALPAAADQVGVRSIGCGDLKISVDGDLSVVCEVANDTDISATSLVARIEYMAAEALGPLASHVVTVDSYQADGIQARSLDWIKFPHPQLPRAYLEFRDPIIRAEILEARDRTGQRIFTSESRPVVLLDEEPAHRL